MHGHANFFVLSERQGLVELENAVFVRRFNDKVHNSIILQRQSRIPLDPRRILLDSCARDHATGKVFKYTLSGSLLGSWTISAGGGSPTGITLDLGNNGDLWIVDSAIDRAYQHVGAASRTSGSLSAAKNFLLAAGNTNPQGIADPPTGASASPFAALAPEKLHVRAAAALGHSLAATQEGTTRPSQKPTLASPGRIISQTSPPQSPLQAIDTALIELFDADDDPFARPAAYRPLVVEPLLDDLAATMR
jgi:hypothetical protein